MVLPLVAVVVLEPAATMTATPPPLPKLPTLPLGGVVVCEWRLGSDAGITAAAERTGRRTLTPVAEAAEDADEPIGVVDDALDGIDVWGLTRESPTSSMPATRGDTAPLPSARDTASW
jgi:hypothetical protein